MATGTAEIIPVKYLLASIVNDTVSIIRMRIMEKPIRFFTNVDSNIPNSLIGDEVRLRQILLNLLSNAVKHTSKGQISVTITKEKREGRQVWLKIVAADSGCGIKPEDRNKLFGDFIQFGSKKNRDIEDTDLGLAATKRLCLDMGGDVTVESEYGKGSSFTVLIPQEVDSEEPFAAVNEPEKKKILVYERRAVYAKSVCWSLENMKVPYTLVNEQNDFKEALCREEWFFVFSGYSLYEKIKPSMERPDTDFPGGKKPPLALMVEWGVETRIPDACFVSLPVQSLSIAGVLNGKTDSKKHFESPKSYDTVRFTLPDVRLLIVDDVSVNLMIAEGLLAPYKAIVDTCLSGAQAIEQVQRQNYDIVFMDHMMPEMDGIEATAAIRAWEDEKRLEKKSVEFPQETPKLSEADRIPIIALTANAMPGVREMYIQKGFSDLLAKPIDISKMEEIIDRWLPGGKKKKVAENKKKLVILVDNDPENLRAGKNILSEKFIVATAPSAKKMFTFLEKNCPVLILLDTDMPEIDGYEAIKILKSKPETKDIPVFFLSEASERKSAGSCPTEERDRAFGAAGYISKPFDPATLLQIADSVIAAM